MIWLRQPGDGSSGMVPADYDPDKDVTSNVTAADMKPETDAELAARQSAAFSNLQRTRFGSMMPIRPDAADKLPQNEETRITGYTPGGLPIFANPSLQIPFTSYALQHQPAPSVNTRQLGQLVKQYEDIKASPDVQTGINNLITEGIMPKINDIVKKYGGQAFDVTQGITRTPEQQKDAEDLHRYAKFANSAGQDSIAAYKIMGELTKDARTNGVQLNPLMHQTYDALTKLMNTKGIDPETMVNAYEHLHDNLSAYAAKETYFNQYAPKDANFGDVAGFQTDKNGKLVLDKDGRAIVVSRTNDIDSNQAMSDRFNEVVDGMTYAEASEKGISMYNDDDPSKGLTKEYQNLRNDNLEYARGKVSPKMTFRPEGSKVTVNNINNQEDKAALPISTSKANFTSWESGKPVKQEQEGAFTSLKANTSLSVGSTSSAIKAEDGQTNPVQFGPDAKVNGIIMLNTKLKKGGGYGLVGKDDKADFTMHVPYVEVSVPKTNKTADISKKNGDAGSTETTDASTTATDYDVYYVPLSIAQGNLINSSPKEDKASIRATIDKYKADANTLNEDIKPEAKKYYQTHFTDINTVDNKVTKNTYTFQ